jgi:hypothetical protein
VQQPLVFRQLPDELQNRRAISLTGVANGEHGDNSPRFAQFASAILVHPQEPNGRTTNRCQADDFAAAPCEMFVPIILSGMKQAVHLSCLRIKPGEICAFVEIAVMTRERQILFYVFAFVLARRDVFDVERQRLLLLPQPAILTATRCALFDQLAQPRVHQAALACASIRRALA